MNDIIKKYVLIVSFVLFALSSVAFAEPVTLSMVEAVAPTCLDVQNKFEKEIFENRRAKASPSSDDAYGTESEYESHTISDITELKDGTSGEVLAYVLTLDPKGFVVISSDTDIAPVIAYSFEGDLTWEDPERNVLLNMIIRDMKNRLKAIPILSEEIQARNNDLWDTYLYAGDSFFETLADRQVYGPLLSTSWHQMSPYNQYCPIDYKTSTRSVVGCSATAMAQIFNYHQYPSSVAFTSADNYTSKVDPGDGKGERSIYITASDANISSISYPASSTTAAKLSFAAGVSIKMNYSSWFSGAWATESAFKNKFKYSSANNVSPSSSGFYSTLSANMMANRPALLNIYDSGYTKGHSVVCDGYNATTGQHHLNFGWDNTSYNYWYSLPSGMPAGYSIVYNGILDIVPGGGGTPGQATLISPSGTISDTTPTYRWYPVQGATYYQLYVRKGSSGSVIATWYAASSVTSGSSCSVTPTTTLSTGDHTWWIQTYNSYGVGPWSSGMAFTVSGGGGTPGQATQISPSGTIFDTTPTYRWYPVQGATYYRLYVRQGNSGSVIDTWYTASSVTSGSICSVIPGKSLNYAGHTWWIQTYNTYGVGPWSSGMAFDVGIMN